MLLYNITTQYYSISYASLFCFSIKTSLSRIFPPFLTAELLVRYIFGLTDHLFLQDPYELNNHRDYGARTQT